MSRRLLAAVSLLLFLSGTVSGTVHAISQNDLNSIVSGTAFYDPTEKGACTNTATTATTVLAGNDNEQKAFNYFTQKGLTAVQAAAVVGNLMNESHLDPTVMEIGGNSNNPSDADPKGWGIAQWTPGDRVPGLLAAAGITGQPFELATQLDLVWAEFSGPGAVAPTGYRDVAHDPAFTDTASTLAVLTSDFQHNFEAGVDGARQTYATDALNKYGTSTGNSGTIATDGCGTGVSCTAPDSTNTSLSSTRQKIVCLAQAELATWKQQPDYNTPYPGFKYAASGFLKYTNGTYEEWCADFATWVYNQAGHAYQGDYNGWRVAYVPNLITLAEGQSDKLHWHPQSSGYTPVPGDLAIYSGASHVAVFIASTGGVSTYIGGDQTGVGQPNGTYGTQSPASGSIVSTDTETGYYNGIEGYVSPD